MSTTCELCNEAIDPLCPCQAPTLYCQRCGAGPDSAPIPEFCRPTCNLQAFPAPGADAEGRA